MKFVFLWSLLLIYLEQGLQLYLILEFIIWIHTCLPSDHYFPTLPLLLPLLYYSYYHYYYYCYYYYCNLIASASHLVAIILYSFLQSLGE